MRQRGGPPGAVLLPFHGGVEGHSDLSPRPGDLPPVAQPHFLRGLRGHPDRASPAWAVCMIPICLDISHIQLDSTSKQKSSGPAAEPQQCARA